MSKKDILEYQQRCIQNYKRSIGLKKSYTYLLGNEILPLVPMDTAVSSIMIIGAYPTAKFMTYNKITNVPMFDITSPFTNESYFNGKSMNFVKSGKELEDMYLRPLGIDRNKCWITNLVKVFLFKDGHVDRYKKFDVEIDETRNRFENFAVKSAKWIEEEIIIAKPKVILLLGEEVTSILTKEPRSKVKKLFDGQIRSIIIGKTKAKYAALPHPGIIMRPSKNNNWPKKLEEIILPSIRKWLDTNN